MRQGFGFARLLRRALITLGLIAIVVAGAMPAPYVIEMPGPVFNAMSKMDGTPIITVTGADTYASKDRFDVLTVQTRGTPESAPTWAEVLLANLNSEMIVVPMSQVYPPGYTGEIEKQQTTQMMLDSQRDAIAVALRKLGYKFDSFVAVDSIRNDTPADGVFQVDDQILSVNGKPVQFFEDITSQVSSSKGQELTFMVLRDGKREELKVKAFKDTDGKYRVGVFVGNRYDFPVNIKIYLGDVTGPSAGLMFSLSIYDLMTPGDLSGGAHVAGTGTISSTGEVGAIGGIRLKMIAAKNAGAEYFIAPRSNCDEVIGHVPKGITVKTVETFEDALALLDDIEQGIPVSPELNCPTK